MKPNANNSENGSEVLLTLKRTLRHLRRQIDKCIDATDEKRHSYKHEIDTFLAEIDAFTQWESEQVAAQAEIDALQDLAEAEQDSQRKLALLNEVTEKIGSWIDAWVEQAVQSGLYVERPLSLAEKKQFYLDFALLNNEQREIAAAARALKYGFPLAIKYGIPFQRHEGKEAARWLHGVADALDALNAPEGQRKSTRYFEVPTELCLNIVMAYCWALRLSCPPTLAQVKEQFVQLFGQEKLPQRQTIENVLKRFNYPLREGKRGRPRKIAPKKSR